MPESRALLLLTMSAVALLPGVANLYAQTVRPVVVEFKEKARAKFELVNNTIYPLNVVLEPRSFSISPDGQPVFRPLDSHIHLKLSAMSFRLPPQQTRLVFYEAWADQLPAWFVVYCTFAGFPQQSGLSIQVELPHTVYLLQKERLADSEVQVRVVAFEPESKRVVIEVENASPRLARVSSRYQGRSLCNRLGQTPAPTGGPHNRGRSLRRWDNPNSSGGTKSLPPDSLRRDTFGQVPSFVNCRMTSLSGAVCGHACTSRVTLNHQVTRLLQTNIQWLACPNAEDHRQNSLRQSGFD